MIDLSAEPGDGFRREGAREGKPRCFDGRNDARDRYAKGGRGDTDETSVLTY